MSEFKITSITNRDGSHGPQVCGIVTFTGSGLTLPNGTLAGPRGRGVFGSGATPSNTTVMDAIEIATTGNSIDFGDDIVGREENYASFSSATRGLFAGGQSPSRTSSIDYVVISSQGGVNDFGNLSIATSTNAGCGNGIRGLSGGGETPNAPAAPGVSRIDFVNISTTGDANGFGDLTKARTYLASGIASPTRGMWHGGNSPTTETLIDFVTISTLGDAVNFGELITKRNSHSGCSNSTRGLIVSGQNPSNLDSIEYITIATEGNATDFGDITTNARDYQGSCASATRGVNAGGQTPTKINVIEFVTISTTGDATDFGDLTVARRFLQGCSDAHGGLAT